MEARHTPMIADLTSVTINDVMAIFAPLGVAGILAWYLWFTTSVTFPKMVEDYNKRIDAKDATHANDIARKDALFIQALDEFRGEMKSEREYREKEYIKIREPMESMYGSLDQLASGLTVLSHLITSSAVYANKGQYLILAIEDNKIDRHVVSNAVFSVISEQEQWRNLIYKEVDKLSLAYELHPFCRLIILDCTLPGSTIEQVLAFINYTKHCNVILYTGTEMEKHSAYALVKKPNMGELKERIKEALIT